MLRSMTGFGEGSIQNDRLLVRVEARSVNNRYLKVIVKLPESHTFLESEIEGLVRDRLTRGTVSLTVRLTYAAGVQHYRLNEAVVLGYWNQLRSLAGSINLVPEEVIMGFALSLPGCVDESMTTDESRLDGPLVHEAVISALESLEAMRQREGAAMHQTLHQIIQDIRQSVDEVAQRVPVIARTYRDRLAERVTELLSDHGVTLDPRDLIREVSIFTDRTDISEEIARLRAHLSQFLTLMDSREPCGRKLEFISQEMFRESNTLGAKSGDAESSALIVSLKSDVERIREMIANVE